MDDLPEKNIFKRIFSYFKAHRLIFVITLVLTFILILTSFSLLVSSGGPTFITGGQGRFAGIKECDDIPDRQKRSECEAAALSGTVSSAGEAISNVGNAIGEGASNVLDWAECQLNIDTDCDGVNNNEDSCVGVAGGKDLKGCPTKAGSCVVNYSPTQECYNLCDVNMINDANYCAYVRQALDFKPSGPEGVPLSPNLTGPEGQAVPPTTSTTRQQTITCEDLSCGDKQFCVQDTPSEYPYCVGESTQTVSSCDQCDRSKNDCVAGENQNIHYCIPKTQAPAPAPRIDQGGSNTITPQTTSSSPVDPKNICIYPQTNDDCYSGELVGADDCRYNGSISKRLNLGCKYAKICYYSQGDKCYVGRCTEEGGDECTTKGFNEPGCKYDSGLGQEIDCSYAGSSRNTTTSQDSTTPSSSGSSDLKAIEISVNAKTPNNETKVYKKITIENPDFSSGSLSREIQLDEANTDDKISFCVRYIYKDNRVVSPICTQEYTYKPSGLTH